MKIGILTFHRAINYGAVLQSYALQKVLNELKLDNEIIDYRSETIESLYDVFNPFLHNIKTLDFIPRMKKKKNFNKFINKWLNLSNEIKSKNKLDTIKNQYKLFITGSDQVWCEKCAKQDATYFLDFVDNTNKKYSYAASIGKTQFSDEILNLYSKYLESYNVISVRENSSIDLLNKCNKVENIYVHLDPTLLLNSKQWDVVRNKNIEKKKYILVYTVMGQYNLFDYAKKLSKETGLPIIYLNDRMIKRDKAMNYRIAVSPEKFVGYFAEAEYVVTNSFHGTAFSIIYHKNFWVEIEAVGRRNIRSEELLKKLQISNRIIQKNSIINRKMDIDWEKVDSMLDNQRKLSREYLLYINNLAEDVKNARG